MHRALLPCFIGSFSVERSCRPHLLDDCANAWAKCKLLTSMALPSAASMPRPSLLKATLMKFAYQLVGRSPTTGFMSLIIVCVLSLRELLASCTYRAQALRAATCTVVV